MHGAVQLYYYRQPVNTVNDIFHYFLSHAPPHPAPPQLKAFQ